MRDIRDPEDPRHGTKAGAVAHWRDGEPPCEPCRQADVIYQRRYSKRRTMGHSFRQALGADRHQRISDLRQRGASWDQLAEWSGVGRIFHIHSAGPDALISTANAQHIDAMRPGRLLSIIGTTRRIRALSALGYSADDLAEETGLNRQTIMSLRAREQSQVQTSVKVAVAEVFDRLHLTPAPRHERYERASATRLVGMAAANGWHPPAAWDDIDDPSERPDTGHRQRGRGRPERMTTVLEDFDWLTSQGTSAYEAAARVGVALATVEDYRRRAGERVA